jgi:hypothetical protein
MDRVVDDRVQRRNGEGAPIPTPERLRDLYERAASANEHEDLVHELGAVGVDLDSRADWGHERGPRLLRRRLEARHHVAAPLDGEQRLAAQALVHDAQLLARRPGVEAMPEEPVDC